MQQENTAADQEIIERFFQDGHLTAIPAKHAVRLIILQYIAAKLFPEGNYSEKEVNSRLADIFADYVLLRRYLVDYRFLYRTRDGSNYYR